MTFVFGMAVGAIAITMFYVVTYKLTPDKGNIKRQQRHLELSESTVDILKERITEERRLANSMEKLAAMMVGDIQQLPNVTNIHECKHEWVLDPPEFAWYICAKCGTKSCSTSAQKFDKNNTECNHMWAFDGKSKYKCDLCGAERRA